MFAAFRRITLLAVALPAAALLVASGGVGAQPVSASAPYPAGLTDHAIMVNGVMRQYRVHVPATLTGPPRAVLLALHGGGGKGLDGASSGTHPLSAFRTVADREGVIDPSGTDLEVHWRTGAWYRKRLARGFTEIGGGLWLSHRSTAPMFELERAR